MGSWHWLASTDVDYKIVIDRSTLQICLFDEKSKVWKPLYFRSNSKIEELLEKLYGLEKKFEECSPSEENLLKRKINSVRDELCDEMLRSYEDWDQLKAKILLGVLGGLIVFMIIANMVDKPLRSKKADAIANEGTRSTNKDVFVSKVCVNT